MDSYIGEVCPVCRKSFVAGDDIVVCPECGAPHHRECYAKTNHCAFESEHASGKVWTPSEVKKNVDEGDFCINPKDGSKWQGTEVEAKVCPSCGSKNPKDNIFCCFCGNPINKSEKDENTDFPNMLLNKVTGIDPTTAIYGGVSPTDNIDEFSARDIATFVGPSSAYYLPQFKAESQDNKRFTFNFSAFFFSFFYFFYRKMYKIAAIIMALFIVASIPNFMYVKENMPYLLKDAVGVQALESLGVDITEKIESVDQDKVKRLNEYSNYASFFTMAVRFASGIFAVKLYYKHAISKLKELNKTSISPDVQIGTVARENIIKKAGGVSQKAPFIMLGVIFLISFIYSFYMYFSFFPIVSIFF